MSLVSHRSLRALSIAIALVAFAAPGAAAEPPATDDEKAFYAIGTSLARQLEALKPISAREMELLREGLDDAINGEPLVVDQQEGAALVRTLVTERQRRALALEREAAAAFVAAAAAEPGATTTESGLVYTVIEAGDGPSPGATDKVRVHYLSLIHI